MLSEHIPLAPYRDIFVSAGGGGSALKKTINTTIVREILSCATEMVCDTTTGIDRLMDISRLSSEVSIVKNILSIKEFEVGYTYY